MGSADLVSAQCLESLIRGAKRRSNMTVHPRLVRSVPFWALIAGSAVAIGGGAYLLVDKLGTMETALNAGTATGVEVYVGQVWAVFGGVLVGAGVLGLALALAVAAARSLVPVHVDTVDDDGDTAASDTTASDTTASDTVAFDAEASDTLATRRTPTAEAGSVERPATTDTYGEPATTTETHGEPAIATGADPVTDTSANPRH